MTEIRKAAKDDLKSLRLLEEIVFGPQADLNMFNSYFQDENTLCYVLEDEKQIVGSILVQVGEERAYIASIGILDDFRRKGYGSSLLQVVEKELGTLGIPRITLHVKTANIGAVICYVLNGFVVDDIPRHFYRDGSHAYFMTKKLN
jgi:ribosomal-protein-alanine N-acetyltransferase